MAILQLLYRTWEACDYVAVEWDQICESVRTGVVPPDFATIRRALSDLVKEALVVKQQHSSERDKAVYRITPDGVDFADAGFPWEEIDPYTGSQKFGG